MTSPNERNSEQQQPKPVNTADQSKNPTHELGQHQHNQEDPSKKDPMRDGGQHQPKQQDPSKKDPSQADDSRQRDREASEQVEKRRA
jgi:hypothetical protein